MFDNHEVTIAAALSMITKMERRVVNFSENHKNLIFSSVRAKRAISTFNFWNFWRIWAKIQLRHFWCIVNILYFCRNRHPTCHNQKVRWEQKWGWHSQTVLRIDRLMNDLMTLYPTEGLDQIQFCSAMFPSTFLTEFDDLLSHKFLP